jgi:hypothetical protein
MGSYIKMYLEGIGLGGVEWNGLAQDRCVESSCECSNEPSEELRNYRVAAQLVASRVVLSSIKLVG